MVVAPSGAGKSSLVNALLARDRPSRCRCRSPPGRRAPAKSTGANTISSTWTNSSNARPTANSSKAPRCTATFTRPRAAKSNSGWRPTPMYCWRSTGRVRARCGCTFRAPWASSSCRRRIDALDERLHKRGQDSAVGDQAPPAGGRQRDRACAGIRLHHHQPGLRSRPGAADRRRHGRRACATTRRRRGTTSCSRSWAYRGLASGPGPRRARNRASDAGR